MTDLSDFGGGIDVPTTEIEDAHDPDEHTIESEQCHAIKPNGERCENPITHMVDDPVCAPHDRAEDVTLIDEVDGDGC